MKIWKLTRRDKFMLKFLLVATAIMLGLVCWVYLDSPTTFHSHQWVLLGVVAPWAVTFWAYFTEKTLAPIAQAFEASQRLQCAESSDTDGTE